jgi:hypothetical protein
MTRNGWLIALAAAFLVGCSAGVMGGILFARFVLHPQHAPFMAPMHMGGPGADHGPGPGGPGGPGGPDGPPGPGGPQRHLAHLSQALGLSDQQRARIAPLLEQSRGQFEALRDSLEARISRELTPEQRARWQQMQRELPGRGARRGPWPRPDRAGPGDEGEPR